MKKTICTAAIILAISFVSVNQLFAVTEVQSGIMGALEKLKMTLVKSKVIGGPQKFKITKETIELLKKSMDEGKVIVVDGDGSLKIEKDKKAESDK